MTRAVSLVLVLCGTVACRSGRSEPRAAPSPEPTSQEVARPGYPDRASLLRRLGEAVDGYRDGRPRWVVAARSFPHRVARVVETQAEADSLLASLAGETLEYDRFGPFNTTKDDPPEESRIDEEVTEVLVYTRGGGRPKRFTGDSVDAVFWSLPAFDKFVVPYLTLVYGPKHAWEEREKYRKGQSELAKSKVVPHYRNSF